MKHILVLSCALLLCGLAAGQVNFLQNGDFSAGMASWVGSGNGGDPQTGLPHNTNPVTEVFDTCGAGANPAFSILPGGNTNMNPNNPPYLLTQKAIVIPGPMELHLDVCMTGPNGNSQGGHIKVSVAGVQLAAWSEFAGAFTAGTYRRHVTFLFTPTVPGLQDVTLELWREKYIWSWSGPTSHTPKMVIDNVFLGPAQTPVLFAKGERKIGGTLGLDLQGPAGNAAVILMGGGRGPGMTFPSFGGSFMLDLGKGLFFLAAGIFDASGAFASMTPIPNNPALAGAVLVFQPLQADPVSGNFGFPHDLALYQ